MVQVLARAAKYVTLAAMVLSNCAELRPIGSASAPPHVKPSTESMEYWDLIEETVPSPDKPLPQIKPAYTWFHNEFHSDGFAYIYGGKTAYKIQKGTSKPYSGILSCYLDNNEYSGVTISLGVKNKINLEPLKKAKAAGIGFWAKAGSGLASVYVGLLDNDFIDKKVQTKVMVKDFGSLDTSWQYFLIPLKRFSSKGKYWDAVNKTEKLSDVDWSRINELRFSTNAHDNIAAHEKPLRLYVAALTIVNEIPGYVDPDDYWASFHSDVPDLRLHDFETVADQDWNTAAGPGSEVSIKMVDPKRSECGKKSLSITYKVYKWCDVMYDYRRHEVAAEKRDWSKFWGLKMDVFSAQSYQPFNIQVSDAEDELFIASGGAPQGWSQVLIPFKDFTKFPYYQPPEAKQNGKFDLNGVVKIDFKPGGEGNAGSFLVDNITLTNDREPAKTIPVRQKSVTLTGSFSDVAVKKINKELFGINAQTWDADLLLPTTIPSVKAVGHSIIRFPGGLTSDEYHWKDELAKKDRRVDIDEFIDFCRKTECDPLFTVNFGTGTPEEAAAWVKHVNIDDNAGVRYWEIGNELYGAWHHNHCSAAEYGKRCMEFIKAMKATDPSIIIAVVWELSGDWNATVFEYVKNIADAIVIHNYPQEPGEENDNNLLSTPQRLDTIISRVRNQLSLVGASGKNYGIWLTEWNSVSNNPGPQSLGMVNALFVADYLGMLAKNNIDQAAYWNIHNGMFETGGDYGYLSRSEAPEGVNVPRPSYWAFKLARGALQGAMVQCASDDINVSAYATVHPDGTKALLIINKYPLTTGMTTIKISGFEGKGTITQITEDCGKKGFATAPQALENVSSITLPPYSISVVQLSTCRQ